jgi:hypothetical protein
MREDASGGQLSAPAGRRRDGGGLVGRSLPAYQTAALSPPETPSSRQRWFGAKRKLHRRNERLPVLFAIQTQVNVSAQGRRTWR